MSADLEAVDRFFPGAERAWDFTQRQLERVRGGGARPANTILGACWCSDDLCAQATQLGAKLFGPFFLGGLAGLPHTGRTGMTAYAHHIPKAGAAYILYGPHLGVDDEGRLGYVRRPGQDRPGPCCGALMATLKAMHDGAPAPGSDDPQMSVLRQVMQPHREAIFAAAQPVQAAVDVLYRAIHAQVSALVKDLRAEFHGPELVTCGVVMIHLRPGEEARIQVRDEANH